MIIEVYFFVVKKISKEKKGIKHNRRMYHNVHVIYKTFEYGNNRKNN